jgi:hypothetical protein
VVPDETPQAEVVPEAPAPQAPAPQPAPQAGGPPMPAAAPGAGGAAQAGLEAEQIPMPTSGRQVFRDVRRQLTEAELATSGVQKIILDDYERAELRCADMEAYVNRYHETDKRAAVLEEKLKADRSIEVFFGVGTALGGAIVGLAPYVFDLFKDNRVPGSIALIVGAALMIGAAIGRAIKR